MAGRGWGKTRVGAEFIRSRAESGKEKQIHLLGPTIRSIRTVMIHGPSGILSLYEPNDPKRPVFYEHDLKLVWPNGTVALGFPSTEPERLRGPQCSVAWIDELCAFIYLQATFSMFNMGLRLGEPSQCLITTTPKATKTFIDLIQNPSSRVVCGSTFDNAANLDAETLQAYRDEYEGTTLGRQELFGELLDSVKGAQWDYSLLDSTRVAEAPPLRRVVVAVDPAFSSRKAKREDGKDGPDETGIVVAGLGTDGHMYVLADYSGVYTPLDWGRKVEKAFTDWHADRILCETNMAYDLVLQNIHNINPNLPVKSVRAKQGKYLRAEPVAGLFEAKRAHMVGVHPQLEAQMTSYTPEVTDSPDRLDSLVYALQELSGRNATYTPLQKFYSDRSSARY